MKSLMAIIVSVFAFSGCGCREALFMAKASAERDAIANALEPQVRWLAQVRSLYPETRTSVGPVRGDRWVARSMSLVYGRYILSISQELKTDATHKTVVGTGRSEFQFNQISVANSKVMESEIAINQCGQKEVIRFTFDMFDKLVASGGRFESIGICLVTNSPIATAQDALRGI